MGSAVQSPGAAVVAEAFPGMQNMLFGSVSQIGDAGEASQKAVEVGDYGFDLGLLQHDLADPNSVGIVAMAPREIAGSFFEPRDQRFGECWLDFGGVDRPGEAVR